MEDKKDYWAAFALGAIVGIGAALLLSSEKGGSATQKLLHDIEPALRRARRDVGRAAKRGVKKTRRIVRRYR
jgi:hypothetical protein